MVERRDVDGWATIDDDEVVRGFVASLDPDEAVELGDYRLPLRSRAAYAFVPITVMVVYLLLARRAGAFENL